MKVQFQADDVRLDVNKNASGQLAPSLASARNGLILLELTRSELEAMLLAFAQAGAAEQGVKVDSVELTLSAAGERTVQASVRVKAKKGFIPVTVTVNGRADVDERLNATVSGLTCQGEGMVGPMVAGMIGAKLAGYNGKAFPLAGDALRTVRLGGLKVEAGDPLRVSATFSG